jgi:hypothetical protein
MRVKFVCGAALVIAAVALACSSTVTGTGTPGSSSSGATGTSGSVGSSGASGTAPTCALISGTWVLSSGTCPQDSCEITQAGCDVTLSCSGGTIAYSGKLQANTLTYKGLNGEGTYVTCNATMRSGATSAIGTCTADDSGESCSFSASRF